MEAGVLKIVGEIAGIGGVALGVLLLVFRQVIAKNIFVSLTREQSYRLLRLILTLVWSIAVLGIAAWLLGARFANAPVGEDQTWKRNYSYLASRSFPQVEGFGRIGGPESEVRRGDFSATFIADLKALVLAAEPELDAMRSSLIEAVERAPAMNAQNPGMFVVDNDIESLYKRFKIGIRAAAVERHVDVEKLEREKFVRPQ